MTGPFDPLGSPNRAARAWGPSPSGPTFDAVTVGDYSVPVDPMDDLQCESCQ